MNSLFIGRFQPLHEGHKKLIQKVLDGGKSVVVALRDTPINKKNPYTVKERKDMFSEAFGDKVKVIVIPDIAEICYGRNVGYDIRRIRLDDQIEEISGTFTRNSNHRVIWLTGNTGAGKTAIAAVLRERLDGIILDGDEMRSTISTDAGFSEEDRNEHNMRVARLANLLNKQGHNIVVSVIAPFSATRKQIEAICNPYWVYIKGGADYSGDTPYEPPKDPAVTIDPDNQTIYESVEQIVKEVGLIKEV